MPRFIVLVLVAFGEALTITLIQKFATNQDRLRRMKSDKARLKELIREIDEIVCDEHPYAFAWHARSDRILYWDRFGHPDRYVVKTGTDPENSIIQLWWFDEESEQALERARKDGTDLPQGTLEVKPWG